MDIPRPVRLGHWLRVAALEIAVTIALCWVLPATVAYAAPSGFVAPLAPTPTVVTAFDLPEKRWQSGHRGVDLAGLPGVVVLAAGAGTIRFAGEVAGRLLVSISHPDGLITTYEPVRPTVRVGDPVSRGDPIGTLEAGHPGCPATACLHWGARRGAGRSAAYLDPLALLGVVRVRLKPIGTGL
ncbi:M23 family metallopeptidase [Gordonia soli]|uniref:M23ase beta-sheet core domain-containing protein n=1 Tax=Gordonia soli NBRC 108243 TaxID=1223545 RepID=M0QNI6_9ACTN|nr:M23 family metallopeptidase [Gordonia soli]GAC68987.1 hypothetical protein GS4_20_00520 [Gordonia soli NBRC 108243]